MFRAARRRIEFHRGGQIHLGEDGDVGRVEDSGVFQGLVFALRDGKEDQAQILAEIERGGTDEVADVLDKQKVEVVQVPAFEGVLHHRGFQMADRAGGDLPDGGLAPSQPASVIVGGQVADQGGHAVALAEQAEHFLQEHRLAGARTGDEADHVHPRLVETVAQGTGNHVVVLQDLLADLHQASGLAHVSISRATTSSSRPRTTSGVGVPQTGQQSC